MIFLPSAKFLYRPQTATNIVTPLRAWEADYGVQTVGADGVTVDAVPVSGNKVKQWTSKVGGIVLSQSVDANRPTYYEPVYGKPYIEMDGRTPTRYLTTGTASTFFTNLDKMTMAVAMRRTGAYSNYRNDSYISFNWGNSGIPALMNIGVSPQFRYGGDPGGLGGTFGLIALGYETSAETTLFGTFSTASTSQTVAGASVGKLYANGAIKAVNTATATTRTTTPGAMDVGRSQDPSVSGIKQFYGVYMYDQELTEAQVAASHADISGRLFSWHTLPVASPALWLDASRSDSLFVENTFATAVTTDNGPVGGWKDLSGNNRHALQSPTTARPTWRTPINGQNGLGVMSFNGSTQYFDVASLPSLASGYTFYGVFKQPTVAGSVLSSASAGVAGSTAAMVAGPAVTAFGNAQISTTQSKFGGASAYFDGTGDYLSAACPDITGSWTVECWWYPTTVSVQQTIVSFNSGAAAGVNIWCNTSGRLVIDNGATAQTAFTGGSFTANQWYHIAVVRNGTTTTGYINGSAVGSNAFAPTASSVINVGRYAAVTYLSGYIDDLRISRFARYTSAFTPPSAPFPDTPATDPYFPQTSLLLHMDGANDSTVFTDSSNNVGTGITQGGRSIAQPVVAGTVVGVIGNYDGTHTAGNYFVRTSSSAANVSGVMTQTASTPATGTASIGRLTNATAYFNSQIYELVVLPRQSNSTEDQAWKDYTTAKWGITWS